MQNKSDFLDGSNLAFVEQLYCQYRENPSSVDETWRAYFAEITREDTAAPAETRRAVDGPSFEASSLFNPPGGLAAKSAASALEASHWRQDRVNQWIHTFRVRGHLGAQLDPLGTPRPAVPDLDPAFWGLTEQDLEAEFSTTGIGGPANTLKLREIREVLRQAYSGAIGVQFMHIDDVAKKRWLIERLENPEQRRRLSRDEQLHVLGRLTDAELFEQFIHKKFVGKKRFSLEGAETLIPLLELALEEAATQGVDEVVLGMAHRGRLNVLVNIAGKPVGDVFYEFQDRNPGAMEGGGDVKYHLGYSSDREVGGRKVHISLCFNPSHLEFVNPVLVGRVRAKQDRFGDHERRQCLGIAIHGDAAFAGQGVTQELLNMAQLDGFEVGGLLHVIVNNQIGFTTSPGESRSTLYATEVARMLHTPIFHVNGEDPEAVAHVVRLAMAYRREFRTDVIIDMYCYRKFGHNEGDEPTFTQPLMYEVIRQRRSVREAYTEKLTALGIKAAEAEEIHRQSSAKLEAAYLASQAQDYRARGLKIGDAFWRAYRGGNDLAVPEALTGIDPGLASALLRASVQTPSGFNLNPKLQKFVADRLAMAAGEKRLDWGAAEILAYASLVVAGHRVRLSGQDSGRGTFTHRHAVFVDFKSGQEYVPIQHLAHLGQDKGRFEVWDSPLSEVGVLGFEYGYSLDTPEGLTLWEAQFGDFCNVAQVIIDQFITSSEAKWRRLSGLVMLLPHGFEGQGPEHSSARLERFLNLCAKDNIQVANPTTPAQIFHLLRRQVLRPLRKPLVVMTPKSMLRLPAATSGLEEFCQSADAGAPSGFRRVLPDPAAPSPRQVEKIILCSGKLFYEIDAERQKRGIENVAVLRLEQYYPLDDALLRRAFDLYPAKAPVVWAQEEPRNMGAWMFLHGIYDGEIFGRPFGCVSRSESASPAIGSETGHKQEQADLLERIFAWQAPGKSGGKRRVAAVV